MRKTVTGGRTLRENGAGRPQCRSEPRSRTGNTREGRTVAEPRGQCGRGVLSKAGGGPLSPRRHRRRPASPVTGPVLESLLSSALAESSPWEAWSPHKSADRFQKAAAEVVVHLSATPGYG